MTLHATPLQMFASSINTGKIPDCIRISQIKPQKSTLYIYFKSHWLFLINMSTPAERSPDYDFDNSGLEGNNMANSDEQLGKYYSMSEQPMADLLFYPTTKPLTRPISCRRTAPRKAAQQ